MTILELVKKYGSGGGEETMWKSVERISEYVDENSDHDSKEYCKLMKHLYADIVGEHFDEECGRETIAKMCYTDKTGKVHIAPYWTDDEMHQVYDSVKRLIPNCYTEWDVYVALNMLMSDYFNLLESWFSAEDVETKVIEMVVSYFNDPDAPHPETKIWHYLCH